MDQYYKFKNYWNDLSFVYADLSFANAGFSFVKTSLSFVKEAKTNALLQYCCGGDGVNKAKADLNKAKTSVKKLRPASEFLSSTS